MSDQKFVVLFILIKNNVYLTLFFSEGKMQSLRMRPISHVILLFCLLFPLSAVGQCKLNAPTSYIEEQGSTSYFVGDGITTTEFNEGKGEFYAVQDKKLIDTILAKDPNTALVKETKIDGIGYKNYIQKWILNDLTPIWILLIETDEAYYLYTNVAVEDIEHSLSSCFPLDRGGLVLKH